MYRKTIPWRLNGTGKLPSMTLIGEARDRADTTWHCSIWMVVEFPKKRSSLRVAPACWI